MIMGVDGSKKINETKMLELLIDECIKYDLYVAYQWQIEDYFVDFLIGDKRDFRFAIEYNGSQHYEPVAFDNQTEQDAIINFEKQKIRDYNLMQTLFQHNIYFMSCDGRKTHGKKLNKTYIKNVVLQVVGAWRAFIQQKRFDEYNSQETQ